MKRFIVSLPGKKKKSCPERCRSKLVAVALWGSPRFAERTGRDAATAEDLLDLVQFGGLTQAIEAGEDRVEEVEQQQGSVLVEEELTVAGLVGKKASTAGPAGAAGA